jgi:hypothetical protein
MDQFEYRVCQAQQSRVTFVNGQWAGSVPSGDPNPQKALNSCPEVWIYLNQAGAEGWQLVSVTTRVQEGGPPSSAIGGQPSSAIGGQVVDVLYLRRPA